MPDIAFLDLSDERRIAYRLRRGGAPTLVFFPGYASDMEGAKALAVDGLAERRGFGALRFDYSGTGSSSGQFEDGTLALWVEESLAAIDRLTEGPLILVGSSMGGWIALHVARERPERVRGLVGIAAAPDFTDWGADRIGKLTAVFHHAGQEHLLLTGSIDVLCPVRLVHGEADQEVPLEIAFRTMHALRSDDVQLTIIKGGAHRLSEPPEIETILRIVASLLEPA
jgi:pimeloyl-ACP methyl ester carboxylesterase